MDTALLDRLAILTLSESQGDRLMKELVRESFRFTLINSSGSVTHDADICLLVGFDHERLQRLLEVVRVNCHSYRKFIPAQSFFQVEQANFPMLEAQVGGALFHVMNVDRFEQL
jgi:uncharacterized protein YaaQ